MLSSYLGCTTRRYVSLQVVTHPEVEPVSLGELKAHCKVTHDVEDGLLVGNLQAAREYVEGRRGLCMIDTQLAVVMDAHQAGGTIRLPRSPRSPTEGRQLVTMESSANGTSWQAIDASQFVVYPSALPALVKWSAAAWPTPGASDSLYRVTWWAGFGATGAAVPRRYRNAILALASHWYLNREAVATGALAKVPFMVDELLGRRSTEAYT
ncbi:MAG: hypothetical protein RLZZ21_1417 [Planctomycetota bacterium]